jgi:hypothetical protein
MSLLGALIGSTTGGLFAASQATQNVALGQAQIQASSVHYSDKPRMKNKTIFSGRIEVQQVCNGYIVHIASREGYEFDSHIAPTIKDVNDLISTAIVAFQLEA